MMHLQILQENLVDCLSKASHIVQQKTQLPILDNILFKTQEGIITITVSSLETTETIKIKGKVITEGASLVPCRQLVEYISSLPPDTVELQSQELSLLVSCKRMKALIPGISPEEFPTPPKKEGKGMDLPKEEFLNSLEAVLFSASHDEARPVLTGVRFVKKEKIFEVITTDGYRLSKIESKLPFESSILLPSKAIKEVEKFGTEEKELSTIIISGATNGYTCFSIGDKEVFMRKIESDYPSYEKIIPTKHTTKITLDTKELKETVKSVAIFAKDNANIIKLQIKEDSLFVKAQAAQVGEGEAEMSVTKEGEDAEISFNSRFLLEFLSNYKEDQVIFEMTGALNPGVFKSPTNSTYLHIIMPVRTGN
jgi:DNA polymerase III subunit beta